MFSGCGEEPVVPNTSGNIAVVNNTVVHLEGVFFTYNAVVEYTCIDNYITRYTQTTCMRDGRWSHKIICVPG